MAPITRFLSLPALLFAGHPHDALGSFYIHAR
jgi:hypothetical protein